eukprot:1768277-Prymnesium_polylepis.1
MVQPPIAVQPCSAAHCLGVSTLLLAVFPGKTPLAEAERDARRLADAEALEGRRSENLVWVAIAADGDVVGAVEVFLPAYLKRIAAPDVSAAQLERLQPTLASLAVRTDVRGRGIGRRLVGAVVEAARERAAPGSEDTLLLQVDAGNTAALELYKKGGFRTVGLPTRGGLLNLEARLAGVDEPPGGRGGGGAPAANQRASWLNPPAG